LANSGDRLASVSAITAIFGMVHSIFLNIKRITRPERNGFLTGRGRGTELYQ
jgi:hypothetical protein